MKWSDVKSDKRYQNASPELQERIRNDFFENVIASDIPDGTDRLSIRKEFDRRTDPLANDKPTFLGSLKDKAIEYGNDAIDAAKEFAPEVRRNALRMAAPGVAAVSEGLDALRQPNTYSEKDAADEASFALKQSLSDANNPLIPDAQRESARKRAEQYIAVIDKDISINSAQIATALRRNIPLDSPDRKLPDSEIIAKYAPDGASSSQIIAAAEQEYGKNLANTPEGIDRRFASFTTMAHGIKDAGAALVSKVSPDIADDIRNAGSTEKNVARGLLSAENPNFSLGSSVYDLVNDRENFKASDLLAGAKDAASKQAADIAFNAAALLFPPLRAPYLASGSAAESGSAYAESREYGLSDDVARLRAGTAGVLSYVTEKSGFELADYIGSKLAKVPLSQRGGAVGALWQYAIGPSAMASGVVLQEGGEEAVSQIGKESVDAALSRFGNQPELHKTFEQIALNVGEAAQGGALGGMFAAPGAAIQASSKIGDARRDKQQYDAYIDASARNSLNPDMAQMGSSASIQKNNPASPNYDALASRYTEQQAADDQLLQQLNKQYQAEAQQQQADIALQSISSAQNADEAIGLFTQATNIPITINAGPAFNAQSMGLLGLGNQYANTNGQDVAAELAGNSGIAQPDNAVGGVADISVQPDAGSNRGRTDNTPQAFAQSGGNGLLMGNGANWGSAVSAEQRNVINADAGIGFNAENTLKGDANGRQVQGQETAQEVKTFANATEGDIVESGGVKFRKVGNGFERVNETLAPESLVSTEQGKGSRQETSSAQGGNVKDRQQSAQPSTINDLVGEKINSKWTRFSDDSGSLGIPRSEMPQIKAEHRGAMVNFLNARGVEHEQDEVPASSLKPTQNEFSPGKVEKAKNYEGGDRSILVSADGHVLDGHHQWLAKLDKGETIPVIRLHAPINDLIDKVREFPSSTTSGGATVIPAQSNPNQEPQAAPNKASETVGATSVEQKIRDAFKSLPSITIGSWHPITVEHNGVKRNLLANQKGINSQGRRDAAIHLISLQKGVLVKGDELKILAYHFKLDGNNNLKEEGIPHAPTDAQLSKWKSSGFELEEVKTSPEPAPQSQSGNSGYGDSAATPQESVDKTAGNEHIRPIVDAITKRHGVAKSQLGKEKAYDRVLKAGIKLLNGEVVAVGDLKIAANELKADKELHAQAMKLVEIASQSAKQARKEAKGAVKSYRERIAKAKSSEELRAIANEVRHDTVLSDAQAQQLDGEALKAEDALTKTADQQGVDKERLANHKETLRAWLPDFDWAERGGRIIRNEKGAVSGRTPWVPKVQEFRDILDGVKSDYPQASFAKMRQAVNKALIGGKLNGMDARFVNALLDFAESVSFEDVPAEVADAANSVMADVSQSDDWLDAFGSVTNEAEFERAMGYGTEQGNESETGQAATAETQAGDATGVQEAQGEGKAGQGNGRNEVNLLSTYTNQEVLDREQQTAARESAANEAERKAEDARREAQVDKERQSRAGIAADAFTLTPTASTAADTKKADEKTANDQFAGQGGLFAANPAGNGPGNEITHNGVRIYKTRISQRGEMWAVETADNKAKREAGERTIGGDTLHGTLDEAKRAADAMVEAEKRDAESQRAEEARNAERKAQEEARKADDYNGFLSDKSDLQKGLIRKTLDKQVRINGNATTIRDYVEQNAKAGTLEASTMEEPKIKPMSRTQFNRADNRQQAEHERKMKEAGNKTTYLVNGYELGRFAHDYAKHLLANKVGNETDYVTKTGEAAQAAKPTPQYKAGDRVIPSKDVFEGDIVRTDDGKLWMAKVKRGHNIPVFPFENGKPSVSADTRRLIDLDVTEVTHTGTNYYGYGEQPKPTAQPSEQVKAEPAEAKEAEGSGQQGSGNTFITDEKYEEAKAKLAENLAPHKLNSNPFLDPENARLVAIIGAYHIEHGARTLAKFTKAMKQEAWANWELLKERIESIFAQSMRDWELSHAKLEPRVQSTKSITHSKEFLESRLNDWLDLDGEIDGRKVDFWKDIAPLIAEAAEEIGINKVYIDAANQRIVVQMPQWLLDRNLNDPAQVLWNTPGGFEQRIYGKLEGKKWVRESWSRDPLEAGHYERDSRLPMIEWNGYPPEFHSNNTVNLQQGVKPWWSVYDIKGKIVNPAESVPIKPATYITGGYAFTAQSRGKKARLFVLRNMELGDLNALKSGVMNNPSIALTDKPITGFGEITFVGDRGIVQPKEKGHYLFSGDAWTVMSRANAADIIQPEPQNIGNQGEVLNLLDSVREDGQDLIKNTDNLGKYWFRTQPHYFGSTAISSYLTKEQNEAAESYNNELSRGDDADKSELKKLKKAANDIGVNVDNLESRMLEHKIIGDVSINDFPYALVPKQIATHAERMLRDAGYAGSVVSYDAAKDNRLDILQELDATGRINGAGATDSENKKAKVAEIKAELDRLSSKKMTAAERNRYYDLLDENARLQKGTAQFSRNHPNGKGIELRDAEAMINRVMRGYKNLNKPKLFANPAQLKGIKEGLLKDIRAAGAMKDVEAAFHEGEIYVFLDNVESVERLEHVIFNHEVGHYGLRGVFGQDLDPMLDYVLKHSIKLQLETTKKQRTLGIKSRIEALEEVIVDMKPEELVKLKGWNKVAMFIRNWLESHGFTNLANRVNDYLTSKVGEDQAIDMMVADMITKARNWAKNGKRSGSTDIYLGVTRLSDVRESWYYSQLEKGIEGAKQESMPAAQWKLWLASNAGKMGIKQDEIQWTGINEYLDLQGKGKVSKADILNYLAQNGVQVQETMLGDDWRGRIERKMDAINEEITALVDKHGPTPSMSKEAKAEFDRLEREYYDLDDALSAGETNDAVKYATYTVPGGKNYRELLLTLPSKMPDGWHIEERDGKFSLLNNAGEQITARTTRDAIEEIAQKYANDPHMGGSNFRSSHFDQPNILAHVRFDERTDADGKRVLFINEIQSDWGQKGKKDGFNNNAPPLTNAEQKRYDLLIEDGRKNLSGELLREFDALIAKRDAWAEGKSKAPPAPFVTKTEAWVSLALKRMIAYAASNGFDKVAINLGEVNNEFYDLSKKVDRISVELREEGTRYIRMETSGAGMNSMLVDADGVVIKHAAWQGKSLDEVIGKELAEKVMKSPASNVFSGLDLKVGGEGMNTFYNQIVPQIANDILKKLGGDRVSETRLSGNGADPDMPIATEVAQGKRPVPAFTITPAMREKVASGLPLFSKKEGKFNDAFWKWFGDSKVVDENGQPLVVYHGTDSVFTEFSRTGDIGYHFGTETAARDRAARVGGAEVLVEPVTLSQVEKDSLAALNGEIGGTPAADLYALLLRKLDSPRRGLRAQVEAMPADEVKQVKAEYLEQPDSLRFAERVDRAKAGEGFRVEVNGETVSTHRTVREANARAARLREQAAKPMALYLRIENPIRLPDLGVWPAQGIAKEAGFSEQEMERVVEAGTAEQQYAAVRAILESKGFDGIVYRNEVEHAGEDSYIAFRPEQIKSAIGNKGQWDANNPDIRYSRKPSENDSVVPAETKAQAAQRVVQDQFNRFKVLNEWLNKQGFDFSDSEDVYLNETQYHGRVAARKEDFRETVMKPLIEKTQKAGFTIEQVADFLMAQHAPEANKRQRDIHQDDEATAYGITDDEARQAMDEFKKLDNFAELKAIASEWRGITEQTKKILLDSGLRSKEEVAAWEAAYDFYIPVKGDEQKTGTGKGLHVNAKHYRRLGHEKRDEAVIENILSDHERAIALDEKNRVGKALIRWAVKINNPDIITVGKPEKRQVLRNGESRYVVQYKGKDVVVAETEAEARYYITAETAAGKTRSDFVIEKTTDPARVILQASPMLADNEVTVYVGGNAVRVQINDEIAARAYKRLGVEHLNSLLGAGRIVNNWLSKVYTGYSPDFIFTNMLRDATQGLMTLTGEYGITTAAKVFANYRFAVNELIRHFRHHGSSDLVADYRAHGGAVGAAYLSDLERIGNDVMSAYDEYAGVMNTYKRVYDGEIESGSSAARAQTKAMLKSGLAGAKRIPVVGHILSFIERINAMTENALRVATYKTLVDSGVSKNRAAAQAKNLMNFNRKGEISNQAGALYLFFNPGVQGSQVMYRALFDSKHKKQVQSLVGMMVLNAIAISMLNASGDDDDKKRWDETKDSVKDGNLVFTIGGTNVTITLPYGYRLFHMLGNVIYDYMDGKNPDKLGIRLANGVFENLSPLGNPMNGGVFQMFPTAAKMAAGPGVNQDSRGNKIGPKRWNDYIPDSQLMNRSTRGSFYDSAADFLNDASGGNDYQKGYVDVSPETLKFWVRSLTGGAGQAAFDAVGFAKNLYDGVDTKTKNMPIIRRFVADDPMDGKRDAFYEAMNDVKQSAAEFNAAKKAHDTVAMREMLAEDGPLIRLSHLANNMKKMADAKRDAIVDVKSNDKLTPSEKMLKIEQYEKSEAKAYDVFLNEFERASKRAANQ